MSHPPIAGARLCHGRTGLIIVRMKTLAAVVLALVASAGCYATGYGYSSVGVSTGYTGTYVNYSTPPPAVIDTDVYYEPRPGYVYINGRHAWVNGRWVWNPGYWAAERPGFVYTQGYWRGNRWYDGRWERQRAGYVYTGGYWDRRGRGHVWVPGAWQRGRANQTWVRGGWSNTNGVRVYNRGRWVNGARGGATVRTRGTIIRDHRR